MKNVVVIGGGGHIGTYLIPKLVEENYNVTVVARGISKPYREHDNWKKVTHLLLDRDKCENFSEKIADLNADIVVDLINFKPEQTESMVNALQHTDLSHYIFCSSIWAHGRAEFLPVDPNIEKAPLDEYGEDKYTSEQYLKKQFVQNGFPATIIMPGQISGPGWTIMNPMANKDFNVFQDIADGEKIYLPNFGMETLHHVHAEDVAEVFYLAIKNREAALGQSFHAVAKQSMTLYGYAKAMYKFFGHEENIGFLSWEKWCDYMDDETEINDTYYHISRSGFLSIENAENLLGYAPKYSTLETVHLAVESYVERGIIKIEKI